MKTQTIQVNVRLRPAELDALKALAEREARTAPGWLRSRLVRELDAGRPAVKVEGGRHVSDPGA